MRRRRSAAHAALGATAVGLLLVATAVSGPAGADPRADASAEPSAAAAEPPATAEVPANATRAGSGKGPALRGEATRRTTRPPVGDGPSNNRTPMTAVERPPVSVTAAAPESTSDAPSPTSTTATPYGALGQWMINSEDQIASWVGVPYQGRTLLEGINIVIVDSASISGAQAAANLNAWMTRASFGSSAFSSTGYQGVIGATTFGQQPTGANAAFRDAYFLLANSHGRVFGPSPNPNGPGYIWTASLSEESLDLQNLTHGYESFNQARAALVAGMVAAGAQNLGEVFMDNAYNNAEYTTGDADGYAAVIGLTQVLKSATAPRGGYTGTPKG